MRITIEFDTTESREVVSMAEEWLKDLVERIKDKDHAPAEEAAKLAREQQVIQADGPALWRSLADFLGKYVQEMKVDFHDDITIREGSLTFGFNASGGGQISVTKAAFPYVQFTAQPNYQQRLASMTYSFRNPVQPPNQAIQNTPIPCRFEVDQRDKVFLQLDGKPFHEAHEAAKYIIEKIFKIPD